MEPQHTAVAPPMQIQIADALRIAIERGELAPGDPLPTLNALADEWGCSVASARGAIGLLKQQGLIVGGRGKAPVVRTPPRRIIRSDEDHQLEKDNVHKTGAERHQDGTVERNMRVSIDELDFRAVYETVAPTDHLADSLNISTRDKVLQRVYETTDPKTGHLHAWSISYIPEKLVSSNPDLLNSENEPWPGGTQHQLSTVGIEIDKMIDIVTATMPTTANAQRWGLMEGVPLLKVQRTAIDITGHVVEISNAEHPSDRAELRFHTELIRW